MSGAVARLFLQALISQAGPSLPALKQFCHLFQALAATGPSEDRSSRVHW